MRWRIFMLDDRRVPLGMSYDIFPSVLVYADHDTTVHIG